MKNYPLFLLLLLLCLRVCGQDYKVKRKVVPILTEQNFYLNGGVRASLGGKSRVYYEIKLPKNTVRWFYSFSTSSSGNGRENLKLAAQLTRLIDRTGMTAIATETLFAPSGVATADIYLMDGSNTQLFLKKTDNSGGKFYYDISASRWNYKEGVIEVSRPTSGTWYLGIKNPSEVDGINVALEVTAIVEERTLLQKTDTQTKAELYGTMGWQAYEKGDYDKCIELSRKALQLQDDLPWVKCNIALCHLVQKKSECVDDYIVAIAACKKSPNPKAILQAALKDIVDARKKVGFMANDSDIMGLIQNELRQQ